MLESIAPGKSCLLVETTEIEPWQMLSILVYTLVTVHCGYRMKVFVKDYPRNSSLPSSLLGIVSLIVHQAISQCLKYTEGGTQCMRRYIAVQTQSRKWF